MASPFEGFYRLKAEERVRRVAAHAKLTKAETGLLRRTLASSAGLPRSKADAMIENVVGSFSLPLGLAVNFLINGREVVVPMVLEEPSVVAGASHAAKIARATGGFTVRASQPVMIGQIHIEGVKDVAAAAEEIMRRKWDVLRAARDPDSALERRGAGPIDLEVRTVPIGRQRILTVHLLVDVGDAMGANVVNTRCERASRILERISGGKARLRILSNLALRRLAMAKAAFPAEALGGKRVVDSIITAYRIADADPYRGATHNKGIMNGIDALCVATGNDWRALEAGAHAYAAKDGRYESLTRYHKDRAGNLVGEIELPCAMGIVGGATRAHPLAALAIKVLGVHSAQELAGVAAAVGLASNVAALRALVTEGIQPGHMRLHRRLARR